MHWHWPGGNLTRWKAALAKLPICNAQSETSRRQGGFWLRLGGKHVPCAGGWTISPLCGTKNHPQIPDVCCRVLSYKQTSMFNLRPNKTLKNIRLWAERLRNLLPVAARHCVSSHLSGAWVLLPRARRPHPSEVPGRLQGAFAWWFDHPWAVTRSFGDVEWGGEKIGDLQWPTLDDQIMTDLEILRVVMKPLYHIFFDAAVSAKSRWNPSRLPWTRVIFAATTTPWSTERRCLRTLGVFVHTTWVKHIPWTKSWVFFGCVFYFLVSSFCSFFTSVVLSIHRFNFWFRPSAQMETIVWDLQDTWTSEFCNFRGVGWWSLFCVKLVQSWPKNHWWQWHWTYFSRWMISWYRTSWLFQMDVSSCLRKRRVLATRRDLGRASHGLVAQAVLPKAALQWLEESTRWGPGIVNFASEVFWRFDRPCFLFF